MDDEPRKAGRPSLSADGGATDWLKVRVPAEEREQYRAAADRKGLTLSEWVREVLKRAARRQKGKQ